MGAINAGTIMAYLDMDTSGFTSAFDTASAQLSGFTSGGIEGALGSIGAAATTAGAALTLGVTTPLVGMATAAVNTGMEFDSQMSRVKAIAGATDEEFEKLRQTAIDLGASTTFSGIEAAEGMENLASAGFSTNEIIAAMPGMLDLAASSGESLASSAGIAASTLRGFGLAADQAGHVADVLAANAAKTNAAVADTGEAMKYVAPMANAMGLSLEEVTAAIGIMSDAGIMGSQAGTTLRGALSRLAKPTEDMSTVMTQLGLGFYDSSGKMKSLEEMVGMLQTNMSGLTDEQRQNALVTLFGQEALSGMMVLMEAGPDKLGALTDAYVNCDGAAAEMAATMTDNLAGDMEGLGGAIESVSLSLSDYLTPVIRDAVQFVTGLVDRFNGLDTATKNNIFSIGGMAAAAGPLLAAGGKILTVLSGVNPLMLGFGAAASLAYTHSETLQGIVASLGDGVSTFMASLSSGAGIAESFKAGLTAAFGEDVTATVIGAIASIQGAISTIGDVIGTVSEGVGTFLGSLFDGEGLTTAWNNAVAVIGQYDWAALGESIKTGVTGVFDTAGSWLGTHFETAKTAAQNTDWASLGASIHAGAVEKLDAAGAWLGGLFEAGKTAAGNIPWGEIGTAIWNGITGVLDAAGNFLSGLFTGGKDAAVSVPWDEIGTSIFSGVTNTLDAAGTFLSGIFTAGKDASALVPWDEIGASIFSGVTNTLDAAGTFLSGIFTAGKDASALVPWNEIGTAIQSGATGLMDAAGTWLSGTFTAAKATIDGIEWGDIGSKISTGLSGALDALGKLGGSIWDAITGWFSGDDSEDGSSDAEASASALMEGLETGITDNSSAATVAASTAATSVSTAITTILNAESGSTITTAFVGGMTSGVTLSEPALTTAVQTASTNAVTTATTTLTAVAGSTITTTFVGGLTSGVSSSQGTLTSQMSTTANAAATAASSSMSFSVGVGIGNNIVYGMASGVRSAAGSLYSAITSIANAAVARARSALDIHSPSGVFADEVGAWIPGGIGQGALDNMQDALGPIQQIRDSMVDVFDDGFKGVQLGGAGVPWQPGGGGQTPQVNITITGDWTVRSEEDRDEIINELYERISEELRRR